MSQGSKMELLIMDIVHISRGTIPIVIALEMILIAHLILPPAPPTLTFV